jgi:hypothetical protein
MHVAGFMVHDASRECSAFILCILESKNKASGATNPGTHLTMAFFLGSLTAKEEATM